MRFLLALFLCLFTIQAQAQGINNPGVVGPGSATSADVALFNGTSGKIIQDGGTSTVGNAAGINVTGSTIPSTGIYLPSANTLGLSTAGALQVQVVNVATPTRSLTLAGSNGAEPTIGTSGGNLAISPGGAVSAQFGGTNGDGRYVIIGGVSSSGDPTITTSGGKLSLGGTLSMPGLTTDTGADVEFLCRTVTNEIVANSVGCLTSSARFKRDIKPLSPSLSTVMALKPVSYRPASDSVRVKSGEQVGLLAEDVAKVDARLSANSSDGQPYQVRYENMVALLVKAVQEQQAQIGILQSELASMRAAQ